MEAQVIIKGNKFEAARAAADRGIPLVFTREVDGDTLGRANATVDELNAWLCSPPSAPPYPAGSLLHWYFAADKAGA
jgi:hypothetical protein